MSPFFLTSPRKGIKSPRKSPKKSPRKSRSLMNDLKSKMSLPVMPEFHSTSYTSDWPPQRRTSNVGPSSCDMCRKRKRKCTRGDPCDACIRDKIECHYTLVDASKRTNYGLRARASIASIDTSLEESPFSTPTLSSASSESTNASEMSRSAYPGAISSGLVSAQPDFSPFPLEYQPTSLRRSGSTQSSFLTSTPQRSGSWATVEKALPELSPLPPFPSARSNEYGRLKEYGRNYGIYDVLDDSDYGVDPFPSFPTSSRGLRRTASNAGLTDSMPRRKSSRAPLPDLGSSSQAGLENGRFDEDFRSGSTSRLQSNPFPNQPARSGGPSLTRTTSRRELSRSKSGRFPSSTDGFAPSSTCFETGRTMSSFPSLASTELPDLRRPSQWRSAKPVPQDTYSFQDGGFGDSLPVFPRQPVTTTATPRRPSSPIMQKSMPMLRPSTPIYPNLPPLPPLPPNFSTPNFHTPRQRTLGKTSSFASLSRYEGSGFL